MHAGHDVVVVTVALGDDVIDIAHVARPGRYRLGTAPRVELPIDIAPLTCFPLVDTVDDRFVCRVPAGIEARGAHGVIVGGQLVLDRDAHVELAIGQVRIVIRMDRLERATVTRPRLDRRAPCYVAASLVAHLAVWSVAMRSDAVEPLAVAGFETGTERRLTRIARFDPSVRTGDAPETQRPAPITAPPPPGPPEREPPRPRTQNAGQGARGRARDADPAGKLATLATAVMGNADLAAEIANAGPLHDPGAAPAGGFGNGRGFDPRADPAFDSVKTGRYATQATGRSAGEQYDLAGAGKRRSSVVTVTCGQRSCAVVGGENGSAIRTALERRLPEIVACYERHAPDEASDRHLAMDFKLAEDGRVERVRTSRDGDLGSCLATILRTLDVGAG